MIGAKPLSDIEIELILSSLTSNRNRCLVLTGIRTGFRISELLSITVQDVVQYEKVMDSITIKRSKMKGKHQSRSVVLHDQVKQALMAMSVLTMKPEDKLFPISRMQASRILKEAVQKAKIEGRVSTHSMRKTFAKKIYEKLDHDLVGTQKALGHASMNSTVSYLSFAQETIDDAIRGA